MAIDWDKFADKKLRDNIQPWKDIGVESHELCVIAGTICGEIDELKKRITKLEKCSQIEKK